MTTPTRPFIAWDNRFADAVPVANNTAAGAAVNLGDFRPYTSWSPASFPATVTVDCGAAKSADSISVFNHDLFSNGCTIYVRGSTDNFVSSNVLLLTYVPASDSPFVATFASSSYRYWRLTITGTYSPALSIVAIGAMLEFPVRLPYGFDPLARKIFGQANISEHGLPLGKSVLFEQWSQQLAFQNVDNSWLRSTYMPAWKAHLRHNPFLFAVDLTNYPSEIYLVESDGDSRTPASMPLKSNLQLTVKGVALP